MVWRMTKTVTSGSQTQIKICGFTNAADAIYAAEQGADALGLVFYPPSSRFVDINQARTIVADLPPFVTVTALFLNAEAGYVNEVLTELPISLLQFHGTESEQYCESFNRPYLKSVSMKSTTDVHAYCQQFKTARGFLLDSNVAGAAGGSGEAFDWSLVPRELSAPLVLAGGLEAGNVARAVKQVRPAAVDVSSGVERQKGKKDRDLMQRFIEQVRAADQWLHAQQTN